MEPVGHTAAQHRFQQFGTVLRPQLTVFRLQQKQEELLPLLQTANRQLRPCLIPLSSFAGALLAKGSEIFAPFQLAVLPDFLLLLPVPTLLQDNSVRFPPPFQSPA